MPDPVVVLIEDEPQIRRFLRATLTGQGYRLFEAPTGAAGLVEVGSRQPDVVIVDLGLPDMDGMDVLRRVRARSPGTPVLILTARDAVTDRVAGLEGGADDYLVKPFSLPELVARIRSLARRIDLGRQPALSCEDLNVDSANRTATRSGKVLNLSPREFDLLLYLMEHRGEVVTRSMLARDVWKYTSRATPIDNVIDVQMSRLREEVDKPFATALILTVRGVGYRMGAPV